MKLRKTLTIVAIAFFLTAASLWMGQASYSWLPPQAAAESKLVDDLFSILVAIGTFIFLGVTGTLMYSVVFHSVGKYDMSDGPPIEGNVKLEIIWTAIPFLLVTWIAIHSYQVYDQMGIRGPMEIVHLHTPVTMESAYAAPLDNPAEPMENIEVLAKQWAWIFRYPEQNITSTELHLPINRRAHFALQSENVIHGFFIPAFRVKQDIIPNRTIDFEFTPIRLGTYRLRDSQYSGTYFAAMQADVVVESLEDYNNWLAEASKTQPSLAPNQAASEYTFKISKVGWPTIAPTEAPVVNYHP